jgi:uncharacterized membrane protein YbhN (UPF0104 family)
LSNKRLSLILRIGAYLLVIGALFLVFRKNSGAIADSLRAVSPLFLLMILSLELVYQFFDGCAYYVLLKPEWPDLTLPACLPLSWLEIFGRVATASAGSFPLQLSYLARYGADWAVGLGLLTIHYIFQKASILIYAALVLFACFLTRSSLTGDTVEAAVLWAGFLLTAVIIAGLVLLLTGKLGFRHLVARLLGLIPARGVWKERKSAWILRLNDLYMASDRVFRRPLVILEAILLHLLKLSAMYAITWFCLRGIGIGTLSFFRSVGLTAIMQLLTGVLPSVSGLGSTEVSYLYIFSPILGAGTAASVMFLFRIATYFFPFLASIGVFLKNRPQ